MNEREKKDLKDMLIELINKSCRSCFRCGYIDYKDNLTEAGRLEEEYGGNIAYVCEECGKWG